MVRGHIRINRDLLPTEKKNTGQVVSVEPFPASRQVGTLMKLDRVESVGSPRKTGRPFFGFISFDTPWQERYT